MPAQWRRAAGSGVVGYNVQVAVDTTHHLIITHEVTNVGTDRSQLSSVAKQAKATLQAENLDAIADRGYFSSDRENAGITVTLPKPMTSGIFAKGRFGKQDFRGGHLHLSLKEEANSKEVGLAL